MKMPQTLSKTLSRRNLLAACGTLMAASSPCKSLRAQQPSADPASIRRVAPRALPAFTFLDEEGAKVGLERWRGRGVIVNLWATWCGPCVREMPALDHLAHLMTDTGPAILAISADHGGAAVVRKFFTAHAIASLAVLSDPEASIMEALDAEELPLTLFVDSSGREVARHFGPVAWDSPGAEAVARALVA